VADKGVRSSDEQRSDASGSEVEGLLRIAGAKQLLQKTRLTPTGQEDMSMIHLTSTSRMDSIFASG